MNEHQPQQPETHPEREQPPRLSPRIWVGSLADYNAGRLHGDWLDAAVEDDELLAGVHRILASSHEPGAEEHGIFDFDEFGTYRVGEYDRLEQVAAVARGIAEHGRAFAAWADFHDGEPGMLAMFEDSYLGAWDTVEAWAEEMLDDLGLDAELDRIVPDSLRNYVYIDYAGFARDAELGGDIWTETNSDGGVWIFRTT